MFGNLIQRLCKCNHRDGWKANSKTFHWICKWCGKTWYIGKGLPPGYRA